MIYLGGLEVKVTIFPDKTSQVWKLSKDQVDYVANNEKVLIKWDFEEEAELLHVLQLQALCKTLRGRSNPTYVILDCPFLPYGRQDKDINNEETFALGLLATLTNLFFSEFRTIDAHSDAMAEYLENGGNCEWVNGSPKEFILNARDLSNSNRICFPDAGAKTRYNSMGLGDEYPIVLNKVRNQLTGEITGLEIVDGKAFKGENVLIVDDLCDGGRTFIETAKVLLAKGAKSVTLYVTHGIFSKGMKPLYESGIAQVYTKDGLV